MAGRLAMKLLLDTAVLLWVSSGDRRLSASARKALSAPAAQLFVSEVSAWEIALKHAKGKLGLPGEPEVWFQAVVAHHGLTLLPLVLPDLFASCRLPAIHDDPFDRLLVACAQREGCVLVSSDAMIQRYPGLATLW